MKRFRLFPVLLLVAIATSAVSAQSIRLTEQRRGDELSVFGTDSSDSIVVEFDSRRTRVLVTVRRRTTGTLLRSASFAVQDVDFIHIRGRDGNDYIRNATDLESSIRGGSGRDEIYGGDAHDRIDGQSGDDQIHGGADNDILVGGDGADLIYGDGGDDFLVGGRWRAPDEPVYEPVEIQQVSEVYSDIDPDYMYGGSGYDVFAFEANDRRVGVHWRDRRVELTVAAKHLSIWWNAHAWPKNGGFFNPVRIWQARG